MDNRWRFLYYDMTGTVGTRAEIERKPNVSRGGTSRIGNRAAMGRRDAGVKFSNEVRELCVKKSRYCSYHTRTVNRTQVDEERILRPAEEALSRNSANDPVTWEKGCCESRPQENSFQATV